MCLCVSKKQQLRDGEVEKLAAGTLFLALLWINNSLPPDFVQKVIVSSRSGPSTYSFLSEPSRDLCILIAQSRFTSLAEGTDGSFHTPFKSNQCLIHHVAACLQGSSQSGGSALCDVH